MSEDIPKTVRELIKTQTILIEKYQNGSKSFETLVIDFQIINSGISRINAEMIFDTMKRVQDLQQDIKDIQTSLDHG